MVQFAEDSEDRLAAASIDAVVFGNIEGGEGKGAVVLPDVLAKILGLRRVVGEEGLYRGRGRLKRGETNLSTVAANSKFWAGGGG